MGLAFRHTRQSLNLIVVEEKCQKGHYIDGLPFMKGENGTEGENIIVHLRTQQLQLHLTISSMYNFSNSLKNQLQNSDY